MAKSNGTNGNGNGNGKNGHPKKDSLALSPKDIETAAKKVKFIEILQSNGALRTEALRLSKLPKSVAYEHYHSDPDFRAAWLEATEIASDMLLKEALHRATVGDIVYTIDKHGKRKGYRKKSDVMLIFLIKNQENQKKWKQRIVETGNLSIAAVRDSALEAGLTEDQIQVVQNKILDNYKTMSIA